MSTDRMVAGMIVVAILAAIALWSLGSPQTPTEAPVRKQAIESKE